MLLCHAPVIESHPAGLLRPICASHHQKWLGVGENGAGQLVAHHLATVALLCVLAADVGGVLTSWDEEVVFATMGLPIGWVWCVPAIQAAQLERLSVLLFKSDPTVASSRPYTGRVVQAVKVTRPDWCPTSCLVAKVAGLVVHYRPMEVKRGDGAGDACVVLQAPCGCQAVREGRVLTIARNLSDQDLPPSLRRDFVKPLNNCARTVGLVVHPDRLGEDVHGERNMQKQTYLGEDGHGEQVQVGLASPTHVHVDVLARVIAAEHRQGLVCPHLDRRLCGYHLLSVVLKSV